MTAFLTLNGNWLFVIPAIWGAYKYAQWLWNKVLTKQDFILLIAWAMRDFAVAVRIGYWVIALYDRPTEAIGMTFTGELITPTYPEWATDNKHLMTLPTSIIYVIGQVLFISHIEGKGYKDAAAKSSIAIMLATAVTWLGF